MDCLQTHRNFQAATELVAKSETVTGDQRGVAFDNDSLE